MMYYSKKVDPIACAIYWVDVVNAVEAAGLVDQVNGGHAGSLLLTDSVLERHCEATHR